MAFSVLKTTLLSTTLSTAGALSFITCGWCLGWECPLELCQQHSISRLPLPQPVLGVPEVTTVSPSVTLCLFFFLFEAETLTKADMDSLTGQWVPGSVCLHIRRAVGIKSGALFFLCDFWGLNSVPHAGAVDTLVTEPSPQPYCLSLLENPKEPVEMSQRKFHSTSRLEHSKDLSASAGRRMSPFLTKARRSGSLKKVILPVN